MSTPGNYAPWFSAPCLYDGKYLNVTLADVISDGLFCVFFLPFGRIQSDLLELEAMKRDVLEKRGVKVYAIVTGGAVEDIARYSQGVPLIEDKNASIARMFGVAEAHRSKGFFFIDGLGLVRGRLLVGDLPVGHLKDNLLRQLNNTLKPGPESSSPGPAESASSSTTEPAESAITCTHCKKSLAGTHWSTMKCCSATYHHRYLLKLAAKGRSMINRGIDRKKFTCPNCGASGISLKVNVRPPHQHHKQLVDMIGKKTSSSLEMDLSE